MSCAFGVEGNIVFFFEKQLLRSERAVWPISWQFALESTPLRQYLRWVMLCVAMTLGLLPLLLAIGVNPDFLPVLGRGRYCLCGAARSRVCSLNEFIRS